jgi:hypothetical protein
MTEKITQLQSQMHTGGIPRGEGKRPKKLSHKNAIKHENKKLD